MKFTISNVRALLLMGVTMSCGCSHPSANQFQGYVEGEYVYVAAPLAGTLEQLSVTRGQHVELGDLLFALENASEKAAVDNATGKLNEAQARHDDITKGLRPAELASLQARLAQARANAAFAESDLARKKRLVAGEGISQSDLEQIQAQRDAYQAQVDSLAADIETAKTGGREDQVRAADAEVSVAKAALAQAQWGLDQKVRKSLVSGVVEDTLYRVGEFVQVGSPVVSLLPPENIKVRFFVPESRLATVKVGEKVTVVTDGTHAPRAATVNFISSQAEFTPPVIYSRDNRAKLVFMIEAGFSPDDARDMKPGQPVDVRLAP